MPIGLRLGAIVYAVDKVQRLGEQRLGCVQARRPHVARAITDQHLIHGLRTLRDSNAPVVNLHFFAGLQVVVENHFFAATDERVPDLHRSEPIDMHVGNLRIGKKERDVGDIFRLAGNVADPGCGNRRAREGKT